MSDGIIAVQDRASEAMLAKGINIVQLTRLNDFAKEKNVLKKDPVFAKYTHNIRKMIRDAL